MLELASPPRTTTFSRKVRQYPTKVGSMNNPKTGFLLSQLPDGHRSIIGHGQERLEAGCAAAANAAQDDLDPD